jgi:hypothetical protein
MIYEMLWDPQKTAVDFIAEKRRALLADQPGSGKTLMSLAALEATGAFEDGVTLILAPKFPAKTTWLHGHVEKFVPSHVNIYDLTSGSAEKKNERIAVVVAPAIVVANHDALSVAPGGKARVPNLLKPVYSAIVIDESHRVLPTNTDQRYQYTQFWRGLSALNITPKAVRLAVSGTPDRSKLENRYGTLRFLFPEVYKSHKHWLFTNFNMESRTIRLPGGRTKDLVTPVSLRNPSEWISRDALYLIRRTKAEIQSGRPSKQYINVILDMAKPQRTAYFNYLREYLNSQGGQTPIPPAVYAIRARQYSISSGWDEHGNIGDSFSSSKFEWFAEWLEERGYTDPEFVSNTPSKVVVASSFRSTLSWLQRELAKQGIRAEILDGGTSQGDRSRIQAEFQDHNSKLRVVLLSMTMGVGIDLDAADDMIFFDVPYSSDDAEQVEDRIDRLSRTHRMTIWWLMSNESIDLAIAETNSSRFTLSRELLDGSRGIEYARQVLASLRS